MPATVLGSGNDFVFVGEGPKQRVNTGSSTAWNNTVFDGAGGFDTLSVDESSTKFSYFSLSMSTDGIVTLTSASGGNSKTVSISNFEKISFWDVTMYLGTAGSDSLTGTSSSESLFGFDGNDTIDGGLGTDKMFGGNGNDIYIAGSQSETVSELAKGGKDTVMSNATYSIIDTDGGGANGGNIENLTLIGTANLNATGNDLNNKLVGNSGNNTIKGGLGNDSIDGGAGSDKMNGGGGNDKYVVDSLGDTATELANGGRDLVRSSVSFTLSSNIENLILAGGANIDATGNAAKNSITGNSGNNVITGGGARDVTKGGGGADTFNFDAISDSAGSDHDLIKDFRHKADHIDLSSIDADSGTAGGQSFNFLTTKDAAFTGHAGDLRFVSNGKLTTIEADINGDKAADFVIDLQGIIALDVGDFIL